MSPLMYGVVTASALGGFDVDYFLQAFVLRLS
jgi:hypothetical protein